MAKVDRELRGTVVTMARGYVDAVTDGKDKKAREYRRLLHDKGLTLANMADTPEARESENSMLAICRASFDAEQVKTASRIERWDTLCTCPDEFTLHILVGADGRYIGHRIVNGY